MWAILSSSIVTPPRVPPSTTLPTPLLKKPSPITSLNLDSQQLLSNPPYPSTSVAERNMVSLTDVGLRDLLGEGLLRTPSVSTHLCACPPLSSLSMKSIVGINDGKDIPQQQVKNFI